MSDRTIISFDYAMKTALRDKANFGILEGFLSELLSKNITILDLLESESNTDCKDGKTNRVDLKARIDGSELAIIEIQFATQLDFFGRALWAASKAIVEQVSAGGEYHIKKVYSINIAYFDLGAKLEYMFRADMLNFNGIHYDEKIPFSQYDSPPLSTKSYIHPEYYLILPNKFNEQINNGVDEWVYLFKNSTVKDNFKAKGIQEAGVKLDTLKMTKAQREAYEKYLTDRQSVDSAIKTARVEGREEGEAVGLAKGKAEGEAAGLAKGKAEGRKEVAKAMKNKGIDANTIAELTGFAADEISEL